MRLRKRDKLIHIRPNRLHPSLHRRNRITLPPQPHAASHHRPKLPERHIRRSSRMHPLQITPKHKNLILPQRHNPLRRAPRPLNPMINSLLFHA